MGKSPLKCSDNMKSVQGCSVLRQYQSAIFRAGRVASDQEASNAWAMRKPIPSSKHKRPRARSSSVTEDPSAQSKEFDRAVEVRVAPEDFQQQSFPVAARQLNFCSCFETTHFDLRRAQRGLSFTHRGGVHFIAINFRTRASRSAKMPAAFCLVPPLPAGGRPAP
jgi:hypothetical protein